MRFAILSFITYLSVSSLHNTAQAQTNPDKEKKTSQNVQKQATKSLSLDFEEWEINGENKKPNGSIINEPIRPGFNPLTLVREEFTLEMAESINNI